MKVSAKAHIARLEGALRRVKNELKSSYTTSSVIDDAIAEIDKALAPAQEGGDGCDHEWTALDVTNCAYVCTKCKMPR